MLRQRFYHTEKGIRDAVFSFLMQQLIAVLACPLLCVIFVALSQPIPLLEKFLKGPDGDSFEYGFCASGIFFGYWLPQYTKDGYTYAIWAWILPALLLVFSSFFEVDRAGTRIGVLDFFGFNVDGNRLNNGLTQIVVLMPALFSILYSIGAFIKLRRNPRESEENLR